MKQIYILTVLILSSHLCDAQTFLNGSFENTTSPNSCNYNMSNATFNSLMQNSIAFGTYEQLDIQVISCFIPSVPDGTYVVGIANNPGNNNVGEAISLELSAPLVSGSAYILSFEGYSNTEFGPQGNLLIGSSISSNSFGVEIYNATTVDSQWTSFNFLTFTAPNNGTFITVMPVAGISSWNMVDDFQIEPTLSVQNNQTKSFKIFPNPSSDFIHISGLNKTEEYKIIDIRGAEIKAGRISDTESINIQDLTIGLYFLKFENGNTIKFIKE